MEKTHPEYQLRIVTARTLYASGRSRRVTILTRAYSFRTGHGHNSDYTLTCSGNRQIRANSSASMLAPPTSAPSTSGWSMMPAMFADFTEPP